MRAKGPWLALLLSLGLAACGGDQKEDKSSERSTSDATSKTTKKKPAASDDAGEEGEDGQDAADETDTGGGGEGNDSGSGNDDGGGDGDGDGGDSDGTGGGDPRAAEEFFNLTVVPVLQVKCIGCHADPRMPVETRAPLSIYSYKQMKAFLADGKGSEDNAVFNRVRNVKTHTGGDRCTDGAAATPCKELVAWWRQEFGEDKGGPQKLGRITEITAIGKVYGFAFDPADTTEAVTVKFYLDGDKDDGTPAGSTVANFDGSDGNTPGAHAFNVMLPDAAKNGKPHSLMAYAVIGGVEMPLSEEPFAYTAYSFTTAGRNYYNASVKPAIRSCTGCHNVDYETQFYSMISPSPAQGATKTNNQLINKPSLSNGAAHGGGRLCGSVNASPCSVFQTWWTMEFGP